MGKSSLNYTMSINIFRQINKLVPQASLYQIVAVVIKINNL